MKYVRKIALTLAFAAIVLLPAQQAHAGIFGLIKAILVKAIKAADLQIQKKQNKVLDLQNAQKKIENQMAKQKLNEIRDWSQKQREQYQKYFDELKKVKNVIRDYQRVKDIIQMQWRLTTEYDHIWKLLKEDKNFSAAELQYMERVYGGMMRQTLQNVKQLRNITTSYSTQMTDGQRLELTNTIGDEVQRNYDDFRRFSIANVQLSASRAKSREDSDKIRSLYGIEKKR